MATTAPNVSQRQIGPYVESELTGWLRKAQKQLRVNGDKTIQNNCCQDFELFFSEVQNLCRRFEKFMRAIRPIGASSGLIFTSCELKEVMKDVLKEFGSNSAEIWRDFSTGVGSNELPARLQDWSIPESATSRLPQTMYELSDQLGALLSGLCDIPQFFDQRLTDALLEFREWLGYRADCIKSHRDNRLVQRLTTCQYIGRVMKEMTQYVSKVEAALSDFVKGGVGPIREAQEKSQTRLQNMSTVATFLSGVTATALQYQTMNKGRLQTAVLGLWIASLILSIASAINSQLAIHWRAAMYRSPRSTVSIWASFLFDHAPLGFLVLAVLAFSVGLVVWTFASEFARSIRISAAVITGVTFVVLFAIIIWAGIDWCGGKRAETTPVDIKRIVSTQEHCHRQREVNSAGGTALETAGLYRVLQQHLLEFIRRTTKDRNARPSGDNLIQQPGDVNRAPDGPKTPDDNKIQDKEVWVVLEPGENSPPRRKFENVVRQLLRQEDLRKRAELERTSIVHREDKLRTLRPVHKLPIFHPSGHDIHFSPDGKRLAISQLDGSVTIWDVDQFDGTAKTTLTPCCGRFGWSPNSSHIVSITKNGMSVLETNKFEGVFLETGTVSVVAWLQSSSGFVAVINDELEIYDTQLQVGKTHGAIGDLPLRVHDVASIPQLDPQNAKELILILGTLRDDAPQENSGGIPTETQVKRPKSACAERRLMVAELGTVQQPWLCVAMAPVLADARHICVSSDGQFALISYGDKSPPELWRLRVPSGRTQLVFRGRFFTPDQLQPREGDTGPGISGKARFCGESDEWVMATDGESSIYIWDRLTRLVLHTLRGAQIENEFTYYSGISTITSTKRSGESKGIMVVSACREGGVIVWEESNDDPANVRDSSSAVAHSS